MTTPLWIMNVVPEQPDKVYLKFPYNPDIIQFVKTELPGPARWDKENVRWVLPLHWDTCTGVRRIASKFNAELKLGKTLRSWAEDEKARQEMIPDVNAMELVELERVRQSCPQIWSAISNRPFQSVGAAFAARNRNCLIADQPGLGKTIQSIAAVIESDLRGPILVVAPKAAAKLTWPQELKRWVPNDLQYVLGSYIPKGERADFIRSAGSYEYDNQDRERVWVITSPNYLRITADTDNYGNYLYDKGKKVILPVGEAVLDLFDIEWSAIIVDECHQTLAGATGNKKKQSAQRLGLGALNVRKDGLRLALSGTPFRGKEEYLWGVLNWLRPDLYRSFWRWCEKHFNVTKDGWGTTIGSIVNREGMYAEAKSVMIRRTKAEVASDLPAKQYGGAPLDPKLPESESNPVAVWLPMDERQAKAYNKVRDQAAVNLEGGDLLINGVLAELTRLKQFAGSYGKMEGDRYVPTLPSNKFDWLVEFLDERGIGAVPPVSDAPKVVVTSQFSQLIDCFQKGLQEQGIKSHKFTGSTSDKDRELIKDDWQNNPESDLRVLLLTTTAGGVSLTLDAADDLVILDETWSASDQEQVEDRIHRLSRIHQVTIWKVFSLGTIEESIAQANLGRENSIRAIIDGQRGVDFIREMVV